MMHRNPARRSRLRLFSLLLCLCLCLPLVLTACDSGSADRPDQNTITSVTVKPSDKTVEVRAFLTDGFLDNYGEKKLYLFEIPSEHSVGASLLDRTPVAECKPKSDVTMTFDLMDGKRSRLYSSYVLASYSPQTDTYIPITSPSAVENPEALSALPAAKQEPERSLKGLISPYAADAIRLGIAHTIVDVPLEDLILDGWEKDAVSYVYNGKTAFLRGDTLEALTRTVDQYTAAGVQVFLRFVLGARGSSDGASVPACLYLPGADPEAQSFAVNMTDRAGAEIMEGFFDYMARTFAGRDTQAVTAFILGYRVNDALTYANAGDLSLSVYVTNYEKLVRVAHTAIRAYHPDGRVYVSLDSRTNAPDEAGRWDVMKFLTAFRSETALRGDYDWHVAAEMYADSPTIWVENNAVDTRRLTVNSLHEMTDRMSSDAFRLANGERRRLLISGFAIPAVTASMEASEYATATLHQSASYAYAYAVALCNGNVEALIYSQFADPALKPTESEPLCGLWTVQSLNLGDSAGGAWEDIIHRLPAVGQFPLNLYAPREARTLYTIFKAVGTDADGGLTDSLRSLIGAPYVKLESELQGQGARVSCTLNTGEIGPVAEKKRGTVLFDFTDRYMETMQGTDNLLYTAYEGGNALAEANGRHLAAHFRRNAVCDPMGLSVTLKASEIFGGDRLLMDVRTAGAMGNTTLTVRLTRPAKGAVSAGDGTVISETTVTCANGADWQTAVCDISRFTDRLDGDDTVILSILADHPEATDLSLELGTLSVTGVTGASGNGTVIVMVVVIILLAAIAGAVVFLLIRRRGARR